MCPVLGEGAFSPEQIARVAAGIEVGTPSMRASSAFTQEQQEGLLDLPAGAEVWGGVKAPGEVMEAGFGPLALLKFAPAAVRLAGPLVKTAGLIATGMFAGEMIEGIGGNGATMQVGPSGQPGAGVVPGAVPATGVGGVPISGPGVPEPPRAMVAKQWNIVTHSATYGTFRVYFFKLIDGRIMCYNPSVKEWKIWRPKKNLVLSANPRLKDLKKLDRIYTKMTKMVRKFAPKPKPATRQVASRYLSAAERKLIEA